MYRIGELAQLAQVSKRTIDYYTNLGLLVPYRSDANYRYYDKSAVDVLQFIEQCKKLHMPLHEIKRLLNQDAAKENSTVLEQVDEVSKHIHQLESELAQLKPLLDGLKDEQRETMMKYVSARASALMQTLVCFVK